MNSKNYITCERKLQENTLSHVRYYKMFTSINYFLTFFENILFFFSPRVFYFQYTFIIIYITRWSFLFFLTFNIYNQYTE